MPAGPRQLDGHRVAERLGEAVQGALVEATDEWVVVTPDRIVDALRWLRDDAEFDAAQLSSLCAVDYNDHFEIVYHLQSLDENHQIVVKVRLQDHDEPSVPSVFGIYQGALFQEREGYDLMGIDFVGHPDLRRLFLWEGFPGHPLRKDFRQVKDAVPGLPGFPYETPGEQRR